MMTDLWIQADLHWRPIWVGVELYVIDLAMSFSMIPSLKKKCSQIVVLEY